MQHLYDKQVNLCSITVDQHCDYSYREGYYESRGSDL